MLDIHKIGTLHPHIEYTSFVFVVMCLSKLILSEEAKIPCEMEHGHYMLDHSFALKFLLDSYKLNLKPKE